LVLAITATFVASLAVTVAGAQAVVVNVGSIAPTSAYNHGSDAGLALVPGTTTSSLVGTGAQIVSEPGGQCSVDAPLAQLARSTAGMLCYHGGPVVGQNETLAFDWDPSPTNNYAAGGIENFLKQVADASGTLDSPYAVTGEYPGPDQATGVFGPAANNSVHAGDYDVSTQYPSSVCPVTGTYNYFLQPSGQYKNNQPNAFCLTDAQIKAELASMIQQNGLNQAGKIKAGYTPLAVLLLPPSVEVCFDSTGNLCSANAAAPTSGQARFCSYHSQLTDPKTGKVFDYVVQPWVVQTGCDESDAPALPTGDVDPTVLATDMTGRLVNPLSQAEIATIVNPAFNGWYNSQNGAEINDNNCQMLGEPFDSGTLGDGGSYELQREFNNAGLVSVNPFSLACSPNVVLQTSFVAPSAVDAGDVVQLDGSKSQSSLLIPNANYLWTFGDGTTATGPSVVHSYSRGGTYNVTLKVTDRGGDSTTSLPETIQVLGPNDQPVLGTPTPSTPAPSTPAPATGGASGSNPALSVNLQLMPQSLRSVLRHGIAVRVSSNKDANGIATVSISRAAARRAHIKVGRGLAVRIGIGTLASVTNGTVTLHLHLSPAMAKKLAHLGHVTMSIRLALVAAGNQSFAVDAAGQY
jgi:hypothetical protein